MYKLALVVFTIWLASGCSSIKTMPESAYQNLSNLNVHIKRCTEANLFTPEFAAKAKKESNYSLTQWDFDMSKLYTYEKEILKSRGELPVLPHECDETKKHVDNLYIYNKTLQLDRNRAYYKDKSNSKKFLQILRAIGEGRENTPSTTAEEILAISQQAVNRTRPNPVSPTIPTYNDTTVLPTPTGYERSYINKAGILKNTRIVNGYKMCDYSTGQSKQIHISQTCPQTIGN